MRSHIDRKDVIKTTPPPEDIVADFWRASGDFYSQELVKSLLLDLQNQYDYSINRLLFCLWFSQLFQQLIDPSLLQSKANNIELAEESVEAMRKNRRRFELTYDKSSVGNLNMVRYHLLEAELAMEKEIQTLLVNSLCDGKYQPVTHISVETLDFLINENISLLCPDRTSTEESELQNLSMLWIQHQDCYN